ncbi:MAG: SDR family oxidoreductase [Granulosicoccus sp.]|nr:SDR family oxidoreductase [Granulosicoccus sp.]
MKILIIGAAGMIGARLTQRLLQNGNLHGRSVQQLNLADIVDPSVTGTSIKGTSVTGNGTGVEIHTRAADLGTPGVAQELVADEPDLIYHLAAIVSGEAEADFDKGYRINLDGTRSLLEAIRKRHETTGYTPQLLFTSSIAVYGAPFPARIDDEFHQTPMTSYGTQKAICELLLADYNRRGIVRGVGLRLPTICIRPGRPNLAASGFFSNILREPINGQSAILPVEDTVRHWFASPRAAVGFLIKAASLTPDELGPRCNLNLPGLSATVKEQIESLERVVGSDAVKLIHREPDATIRAIVANWPESFDTRRATALGFVAETSFDDIIKVYLEDDWSGT